MSLSYVIDYNKVRHAILCKTWGDILGLFGLLLFWFLCLCHCIVLLLFLLCFSWVFLVFFGGGGWRDVVCVLLLLFFGRGC